MQQGYLHEKSSAVIFDSFLLIKTKIWKSVFINRNKEKQVWAFEKSIITTKAGNCLCMFHNEYDEKKFLKAV